MVPIIWRFTSTVSGHFSDILRTKQDSWGLIRQNESSFREIRKQFNIICGLYRFRFNRNDCRADWSRFLNCLYRRQSEKYSAKWDRGFTNKDYYLTNFAAHTFIRLLYMFARKYRGTSDCPGNRIWPCQRFICEKSESQVIISVENLRAASHYTILSLRRRAMPPRRRRRQDVV